MPSARDVVRRSRVAPVIRPIVGAGRRTRAGLGRRLIAIGVGLTAPHSGSSAGPDGRRGGLPLAHRPARPPVAMPDPAPEPPEVDGPMEAVRSILPAGPGRRYDVELFEQLCREYADRPLVPAPLRYDRDAMAASALGRVTSVHRAIDLAGAKVLEVGCGGGFELWYAAHALGADAWGVDVQERRSWSVLQGDRVHLLLTDLSASSPFEPDTFDRAMSFTVWEHVLHPYRMLVETHRVLRPGALFWMKANLHRGPQASHLYRDIPFPFPHLLFSDEVISDALARRGREVAGAAWVNRLTWDQYERYFDEVGFRMRALRFRETPLDDDFYARFEDILGRYPRWDLTKDFFEVVLEKVAPPRRLATSAGSVRP
jgi:SAM-dependent methyltransferase